MSTSGNSGNILVSELATDADMVELVEKFVSELPQRVNALRDALNREDHEALTTLAHQLKGAAGGYGFPTITDAARHLEASTKDTEDIETLSRRVKEIADLCNGARATHPED